MHSPAAAADEDENVIVIVAAWIDDWIESGR